MAVEIATAYVQLQPSARGFQSAIEREIGGDVRRAGESAGDETARSFGTKFSSGLKTAARTSAVAFGAAFVGAAALSRAAISAASELEEVQSKVNVVFGESADEISSWASTASTSFGQSKQQALDAAGSFGNMFTQLGIGSETAAAMSTSMVELASDFASFHNADITEVLTAQQAAFRGEYDALQRFVPTINAAAVEQRAMELGLAATTGELDAQDRALATQTLMMEGAGEAMGDFDRTSGSLANQQRTLAARFQDAQASIGRALLPAMTAVVGFIADKVIPKVQELAERVLPVLRDAFTSVAAFVRRTWPGIREVVGNVVDAVRTAFTFVIDNKPILIGVLTAMGVGFTVWATSAVAAAVASTAAWVAAAAPFVAIGVAIAAVVAGAVAAYQRFEWFRTAVDAVVDAVVATAEWLAEQWRRYSDDVVRITSEAFRIVSEAVTTAVGIIRGIIEGGVAAFKVAWEAISFLFDIWKTVFYDPVKLSVETLMPIITTAIELGVAAFKVAWSVIEDVFTFFRDNVYTPVKDAVDDLASAVSTAFTTAVDGAKLAWGFLADVVTFFQDSVYTPIADKVTSLATAVSDAFTAAVDGAKLAWDKLADIVKTPINLAIGFYNNGLRSLWNNVVSKIPGVPDLPEVATLNKGGWVPGVGDRDTVRALLTPGEFVVTKDAAKAWGPKVLEALNDPRKTIDPGIFGYAKGGYVRTPEEALAWARQQHGKPYEFPDVGPNSFDCSGFTSALINYIMGLNPWSRRHSSGNVANDPALDPGVGDPSRGLTIGAKPPYTRNVQGASVGHVAATLAGVNMEATPPRVVVGGGARGAGNAMFTGQYHLPNFGGLTTADQAVVDAMVDLGGKEITGASSPWGDIFYKLVNQLPAKIVKYLAEQLPKIVIEAIKDAFRSIGGALASLADALNPFDGDILDLSGTIPGRANGGMGRDGALLVGERGPEVLWGTRGMYVESHESASGRLGGTVNIYNNHQPFDLDREVRKARLLVA